MSNEFSMFDLAPGKTVLDRFEIVRATRQNDLALTFEAKEGPDECEITFFPPALFDSRAQVEEFCRFWESWKSVDSRHVTSIREVIPISGECALIIADAPPGQPLRDWLSGTELMETSEVLRLGVQLAEGLVEIHGAKLVHGDLKPQTIHATGQGESAGDVVMVGGGVTTGIWNAKGLGERTALIGTPYYAPIEQFGGESPDERSDIYNVAAVLFELACGVLPWPGKSFLEVFQAKLDKAPPSMKRRAPKVDVAPEAEAAIVKGLLADRNDRYATASELLEGLRAVS